MSKRIEIIRGTVAGGKAVEVGQKLTVPDEEAKALLALGKARYVDAEAASADETAAKDTDTDAEAASAGKNRKGK